MKPRTRTVLLAAAVVAIFVTTSLVLQWLGGRRGRPPSRNPDVTRADLHQTPPASRPVLWLLSIGVSRYQNPDIALRFADADAHAVADQLALQRDGPIYSEVHSLVLTNEDVSRESILGGLERFLGQAGPDDVAAIFMAGHGVQDRATGSYYFLPYPAAAENLLTAGLRMSDFDEMVRVLRRNVRRVVILMDTCHSGALRLPGRAAGESVDLAAQVSVAEGLYLLAATKPGEESRERDDLGHGAFTYALLEGMRGAADGDRDGLVTVSDLFGYVARHVPRLTEGRQHPYHKIEGTELALAAIASDSTPPSPPAVVARPPQTPAAVQHKNSIAVMEFRNLRREPEHDWIGTALRVALNTELTKVGKLQVYAPELIDRKRGLHSDDLQTARQLGVAKLLSGTFAVLGPTIRIDARIVDTSTGVQEGSESAQGELDHFFEIEKQLVLNVLRRLPVALTAAVGDTIKEETNTSVNAYRLLLEAEGVAEEAPAKATPGTGSRSVPTAWLPWFVSTALAQDTAQTLDEQIQLFLEQYRRAHEQKDVDLLASLYLSFSERQRIATQAYLKNADDLVVGVTDVEVKPQDDGVAVSYTRRDSFTDKETGQPAKVEVRLTKILVRHGGQWKFAGGS